MMSTAYQAARAGGTKGQCRAGKVRHTVTLDRELFEAIKTAAIANRRSVSEEMAAWLDAWRNGELNPEQSLEIVS